MHKTDNLVLLVDLLSFNLYFIDYINHNVKLK